LYIGKAEYELNGEQKKMDTAALLISGRTFVPARYVAEAFDAKVSWDPDIRTVYINTNSKPSFCRDAAKMHEEYFTQELGDDCKIAPGNLLLQRASSVARLAYLKAMNNELESCFDMVPFYLRKSQAEREYEKKLCKDC